MTERAFTAPQTEKSQTGPIAPARSRGDVADLLSLTQWLSPAFPLGAFSFSHGLETGIAKGSVGDAARLEAWIDTVLRLGSGRCDAILLSLAHRSVLPDPELAALAAALAPSRERWDETLAQGAAFARTTNALLGTDLPAMALPVAVGVQARQLALDTRTVLALYLQAFASNLVTIATRAVPLGQTESQIVLDRLARPIADLAHALCRAGPEALASATPGSEIASMRHETAEIRLFRS